MVEGVIPKQEEVFAPMEPCMHVEPLAPLTLDAPNDAPSESYTHTCSSSTRSTCTMTLHWAKELHMAPLQIRYSPPDGASEYRRRIVVQLAATHTLSNTKGSGAKSAPVDEVEGGHPLIYEAGPGEQTLPSGWIQYVVGSKGGRGQGLVSRITSGNRAKGDSQTIEMASRWIERLQEATEELVADAVGQIRDVQAALVHGASQQLPLSALCDDPMANGASGEGREMVMDEPRLMIKSISHCHDPILSGYYREMCDLVKGYPDVLAHVSRDKEGNHDENRPKAFYQVTDCNLCTFDLLARARPHNPGRLM